MNSVVLIGRRTANPKATPARSTGRPRSASPAPVRGSDGPEFIDSDCFDTWRSPAHGSAVLAVGAYRRKAAGLDVTESQLPEGGTLQPGRYSIRAGRPLGLRDVLGSIDPATSCRPSRWR